MERECRLGGHQSQDHTIWRWIRQNGHEDPTILELLQTLSEIKDSPIENRTFFCKTNVNVAYIVVDSITIRYNC